MDVVIMVRCVVVNILSTVGPENTYTPARLQALEKAISRHHLYHSCHPEFAP